MTAWWQASPGSTRGWRLACLAVAVVIVIEVMLDWRAVLTNRRPADPAGTASGISQLADLQSRREVDLGAYLAKPILAPSRRPIVLPNVAVAEAAAAGPAVPFELVGTVLSRAVPVALLRQTADGTTLRVTVGEEVAGWTVTGIEEESVLVTRSGRTISLSLRELESSGRRDGP